MSQMKIIRTLMVVVTIVLIAKMLETRFNFISGTINDSGVVVQKSNATYHLEKKTQYLMDTIEKLVQQRNSLSRTMNLKQQKLGQIECEKVSKQKTSNDVSSTGGWCSKESVENSGRHMTDTKLVPALAQLLKGKYVGSFGDGPGRYKQLLTDSGLLKGYDAYDGAPYSEETSMGSVMYLDLTLPQYGLPLYDWILSLEVAEHIPAKYERIYLDNIVRHAKEGVILSWAKPGQGGFSHVNGKSFEYVNTVLRRYGLKHDAEYSQRLKNSSSLIWLQNNINVYRRKKIDIDNNIMKLII